MKSYKGLFITFEGVDGVGKTTQAKLLNKALNEAGFNSVYTKEPGGNIRKMLLDPESKINPISEMLLYAADRAQHVEDTILPHLHKNSKNIVVCDRYVDSTSAYQCYGLRIPMEDIQRINYIATRGLLPNLTILLDCNTNMMTKQNKDRIEQRGDKFYDRVAHGYRMLAKRNKRFKVVNSDDSIENVSNAIWNVFCETFNHGL